MFTVTLLVGLLLYQNSPRPVQGDLDPVTPTGDELAGFSAAHWYLPDDDLLGFVAIPAGSFIMGSDPDLDPMAYRNERWSARYRQGEVELPRYFIARYETTVAQFAAYIRAGGAAAFQWSPGIDGSLPVTNVTWPEALAYTRWLDRQLRQSTRTPAPLRAMLDVGAVVTLPDEAQWEKAARGTDGRVFPWRGVPAGSVANYDAQAPRPVTSSACRSCIWGLNDMAGNVWEFTRSPLQDYPFIAEDDADDLAEDVLFVMRGGSFADSLNNIRAAVRGGVDPGARSPAIGFRVVISEP